MSGAVSYVGATVRWAYGERTPIPDTWDGLSDAGRERALPYWLDKAKRDPWAFDGLLALAARLEVSGEEKPDDLRAFMVAYLLRETEPPKGFKSDPTRDARIAYAVHFLCQLGVKQTAAFTMIGKAIRKSDKTVESARRRGLNI